MRPEPPNILVAGGGPAGVLCALLFARRGLQTTLVERSSSLAKWDASRSYSINLNARGCSSLEKAGLLSAVQVRRTYATCEYLSFAAPLTWRQSDAGSLRAELDLVSSGPGSPYI
eukprot:6211798-Pleurochrysis_carterae.AAC.2